MQKSPETIPADDTKLVTTGRTFNAIASYLVTRPYREVSELLGLMSQETQTLEAHEQGQAEAKKDPPTVLNGKGKNHAPPAPD